MGHRNTDFLDELVAEGTARWPDFPELLEAARQQRAFGRELAGRRKQLGLTQTELAHRMHSTQHIVSKLENGGDVNITTLRRCTIALGLTLRVAATRAHKRAA